MAMLEVPCPRALRLALAFASWPAAAQTSPARTPPVALTATTPLEAVNGRVLWVDYRGRRALKLAPLEGHERDTDQEMFAVVTGSDFRDGVIEVDVAGARREGYSKAEDVSGYKGIIGVTFRLHGDSAERFYLRPENTRLDNQLFRNRSTQYESSPDFPWQRLRQENPGVYESYADVEPGAWTKVRIEVRGATARLFVNGAAQPSLIVSDLRLGESHGSIALWARISTDAYFSNLRVTPTAVELPPSTARPDAGTGRPPERAALSGHDLPVVREVLNGRVEPVSYRGERALKLVPAPATAGQDADMLAILDGPAFKDGTIELRLSGAPRDGMPADARGFIGLAMRTGEHGEWSEVMYLRPTNGRANDQLRRNHAVQYVSHPDHPWYRLRQETPGTYESYADLVAGEWTTMKIVVAGTTARLYVNGAAQPCLVVTDLKHGDAPGRIALWANVQTDAYFGAISVVRR